MLQKFFNIFRIPDLRNKMLFTVAMLVVYRIGFYIPLPGVNAQELIETMKNSTGALGTLEGYMSVFSGGALNQSTIFSLGIMPYISASIIMQLMGTVMPSLEKLKKEGEPGMRKITEWTRYLSVAVCVIQAWMWMKQITGTEKLLYHTVRENYMGLFWIMGLTVLTAGSVFLMWLGEQIDQYGIGNGVSLIITAGIVARMPDSIMYVYSKSSLKIVGTSSDAIGPGKLVFLVLCFVFVVAGSIYLTEAQRRISVKQAKHMRGRRVYGGQTTYLPLRVNHAGVMPIIFASSLMIFPVMGLQWLGHSMSNASLHTWWGAPINFLIEQLGNGSYLYEVMYCVLIFFFSYFWNTVQFQPKEMADQLRDYGSFIPGLRPGKRTADYLESVMNRITYVGAAFLCVIAVVPSITATQLLGGTAQDYQATQFLGGTGLLIVISVMLDFVNRIEANLVMRNYSGFMEGGSGGGSGAKIRRPKGGAARKPNQPALDRGNPKGLPA